MKFYEWRMLAYGNRRYENHVFDKGFGSGDGRISLCDLRVNALNGEYKNEYYCPTCKEKAVIAEAKAQEKEDARVAKLELKRSATLIEINDILKVMQIDKLLSLLRTLK